MKIQFKPLLALLLACASVHAVTIWVPGDRPTIQAGIDSESNGDTVLVGPGEFIENFDYSEKKSWT
jgi:hypothetical protein